VSAITDWIGTVLITVIMAAVRYWKLVLTVIGLATSAFYLTKFAHHPAPPQMDVLLTFSVVVLPIIFGISVEVVPKRVRENPYYRAGMVLFGFIISALIWIQMSRATKTAGTERQSAIIETAAETASRVNVTLKENVLGALNEYNDRHPKHEIPPEVINKIVSATAKPAPLNNFTTTTNAVLSDRATVAAINLRNAYQDWFSEDHEEYMKMTDPPRGHSPPNGEMIQQADNDWGVLAVWIAKTHCTDVNPLIVQANEYRVEMLNRLPLSMRAFPEHETGKALFERLIQKGSCQPRELEKAGDYLDALRKSLP
jgi:hypothetical protein